MSALHLPRPALSRRDFLSGFAAVAAPAIVPAASLMPVRAFAQAGPRNPWLLRYGAVKGEAIWAVLYRHGEVVFDSECAASAYYRQAVADYFASHGVRTDRWSNAVALPVEDRR